MNNLTVFQNEQFGSVRTISRDGEPWFVAADVCRALEHSNVTVALDRLDDDEKAKFNLGLRGGDTGCVNEPGLYSLVLGSRKPEAKAFKRWITHEVIPAIRKHGAYASDSGKTSVSSDYDRSFVYTIGETVEVENFDKNRWEECAPGIHFFITRDEAVRH